MLFSFLFNPINKGPYYSKTSLVSYSNKKLSKSFKDYDIRDLPVILQVYTFYFLSS